MRGIPVVPGVAYGPAFRFAPRPPEDSAPRFPDPDAAMAAYDRGVRDVADAYTALADATSGSAARVLETAAVLTHDPALRAAVAGGLDAGLTLPRSLGTAVQELVDAFTRAGGAVAGRTIDLRDIERRLLTVLAGGNPDGQTLQGEPSVLLAVDLAPADVVGLDATRVLALVTERGSPTGHAAVVARERGIPCVVGVPDVLTVASGTPVLVDGTTGEVDVRASRRTAMARIAADDEARSRAARWTGPGVTRDGSAVRLMVNLSDAASAGPAARGRAEGVGLFRTELCFLDRDDEPTVAEQVSVYAEVLDAFGPDRDVVFRTLDAGSDKPLRYLATRREANPALGVRGVRVADRRVLDRQLDAIAAAGAATSTSPLVMAPMVATVAEAAAFADAVRARGLRAGVMVEVPAAALQARRILEHVDFLSIGTNDLAQYTMAADRNTAGLAPLLDPWQPAVLGLVALTAEAGRFAGKPVSVCGEAAADPLLAVVLVGLGIGSLSMAPSAVGAVGTLLAEVTRDSCGRAAEAALGAEDPLRARSVVREILAAGG